MHRQPLIKIVRFTERKRNPVWPAVHYHERTLLAQQLAPLEPTHGFSEELLEEIEGVSKDMIKTYLDMTWAGNSAREKYLQPIFSAIADDTLGLLGRRTPTTREILVDCGIHRDFTSLASIHQSHAEARAALSGVQIHVPVSYTHLRAHETS